MSFPVARDYQRRAIAAARASVVKGKRRVILVSPTGSGKTITMGFIAHGAVTKRRSRVAWFAHRSELRDQAVAALETFGLEVGHSGLGKARLVQVVSTQGSTSCGEVPEADIVFLDECHHYAADDWGRLPLAYPNAIIIGATATPERGDGRPLGDMFDELHVVAQPRELVDLWQGDHTQGLVPCDVIRPSRVQRRGYLSQPPVEAYVEHARGRRNVVFASDVREACDFAAQFRAAGIPAHIVHGQLSADVRAKNLDDFAAGRVRVIVNVFVLTEGWDCPATDCVTIARKMGSASMFIQAAGRGARPAPGKSSWLLMDLAGVTHLHGHPFDDRLYALEGEAIKLASDKRPRFCRMCGEEITGAECANEDCRGAGSTLRKPARFSGDPLEKFEKYKTDTEEERCDRLAKFIGQAREQGHNWKRALFRYRGMYGAPPSKKIVSLALRRAGSHHDERDRAAAQ